jgi:hypothetical protein
MGAQGLFAALWLISAAPATTGPATADPEAASGPAAPGDDAEPAPGAPDQQAAVKSAYAAAESLLGPLDGLWRLEDTSGRALFILDLSDPGPPPAPLAAAPDDPGLEGAWRDPADPRAPDASGLIDGARRSGDHLSIAFTRGTDQAPVAIDLRKSRDGRWTGALTIAGARQAVVMTRF